MSKSFFKTVIESRNDSPELQECISRTVERLLLQETSSKRPAILLGKIQSGKTRAFLGVIALAFDKGYDLAIVLTKGTIALARQTLIRIKKDFKPFCNESADDLLVHDIMSVPKLTQYELSKKQIIVVKKEDDNMRRLLKVFEAHPELKHRKVLVVDDEADLASVTYRREKGLVRRGVVSVQIDQLRQLVKSLAFLQVTATPYSLYLQPEEDIALKPGTALFQPKRPAFTEVLPTHQQYVGGEFYFEQSTDERSPAFHLYKEVPDPEREALKQEDGRRLNVKELLTAKNTEVLRQAIVTFLLGACVRRIQQESSGEATLKYSFLFHTESAKRSHKWQERVVTGIRDALVEANRTGDSTLSDLLAKSFADLKASVLKSGLDMPTEDCCSKAVHEALSQGWLMITTVNSESEVDALLDDEGQLKLRTPMNLFIGGQILDRGITIQNLIGFYYGRTPRKFQQDTVLQHSRMFGNRPHADLGVTRFYTPPNLYQVMKRIHEFDSALREAFLCGVHDRGVYFIRRDSAEHLSPCSPNKVMFSSLTSIKPGKRLVPVDFQTVNKTQGSANLRTLDSKMQALLGTLHGSAVVSLSTAVELLTLACANLEFGKDVLLDGRAMLAALEHLSKMAADPRNRGQVFLLAATGRKLSRLRENGRFSDAPDSKQEADQSRENAKGLPTLMLFRQDGLIEDQWRGLPFWWPVIVVPSDSITAVFAAQRADEEVLSAAVGDAEPVEPVRVQISMPEPKPAHRVQAIFDEQEQSQIGRVAVHGPQRRAPLQPDMPAVLSVPKKLVFLDEDEPIL